jgi:nicotinamide-nucleotide amidase
MSDPAVFTGRAAVRAGVLITGTEVLTGIITDRNGPWLSERLREAGVDAAMLLIVGDRPEDMRDGLRYMASEGLQLVVTSGGLGPTADDLTASIVGEFCGREMVLDERLDGVIAEILKPMFKRWPNADPEAVLAANRKQAMIPQGATVLDPVGTAPGLVVAPAEGRTGPTVVVLPGPPSELQPMWYTALKTDAFKDAIVGAVVYEHAMLRMFGVPESEIANTLRDADAGGVPLRELEITTCLRRGELEVSTRFAPESRSSYEALLAFLQERHGDAIFSPDGATIDQQIATQLTEQGLMIATAESCTGGLLAARLTERAGSSAYVLGGAVVYSNEAKQAVVGVEAQTLERFGAVSVEVARELADGARRTYGASVGVGITGIAGPDGGTEEKPVGTVCISVTYGTAQAAERVLTRRTRALGDRAAIRDRSTTVAMHMISRLLGGESD